MWSDLLYLQSLPPFNKANLTDHILANPTDWQYNLADKKTIEFDNLPNKDLIDIEKL
jgi:hypothetical protein